MSNSVPPPPPRRRAQESTVVIADHHAEPARPQPQRPDLPVIPRLELPRANGEPADDSANASTIPPAGRSTFIRSPSEILESRTAPAATTPPSTPLPATAPRRTAARALERISELANAARAKVPDAVRARLEGISPPVLYGSAAMGLLVLGSVGAAIYGLATAPSSTELVANAPASAGTQDSAPAEPSADAAKNAPAAASPRAPGAALDEASVLLELAESMLAERRDADALPPLERLIARKPELKDSERLGRILLAVAASNDRQAAAKSHALLTGPMGEAGAALIYELSLKSDVRDGVRQRAENWLKSKDFDRVAPLSVYAAVRLRNAASCEDKRALLDFAAKAGGKYVLAYLKDLESKKACAPDDSDCFSCLRSDPRLTKTIAQLQGH